MVKAHASVEEISVTAEERIKDMADRLISTLDTLMPSATADLIVRTVATTHEFEAKQ